MSAFLCRIADGQGKVQEIHRDAERTFTHEVEIADVDGDKKLEFFTTPSAPNRLDGTPQGGRASATPCHQKPFAIHGNR